MPDVQGGDILSFIRVFLKLSILAKLPLSKKRSKLGIQLPNAGDESQSCRILTVLLIGSIGYGFRSIISTVVLYSIQIY